MAKDKEKTVFLCGECGYESPRWMGKCPACGSWNTLVEETAVSVRLPQQRGKQMHLLDLLVLVFDRQRLRGLHRAKRFLRIFLSVHKSASFI